MLTIDATMYNATHFCRACGAYCFDDHDHFGIIPFIPVRNAA